MRTVAQPSLFPEFDSIAMELEALASAPPEEREVIRLGPSSGMLASSPNLLTERLIDVCGNSAQRKPEYSAVQV